VDPALADAIHADTLPAGAIPAVPSHPPARPPIPALLAEHLAGCALHRATGVLRVTGEPGGAVHLTDGQVTAISTPGAPDPEVILLRSGRIGETGWSQVFASAAAHGRMPDELVKRGLIGAGELESLLRMALADAMFALAAGHVEECVLEQDAEPHLLPLQPAARPPERGSVLRMLRPGSGAHRQPDRQAGSRRAEGGGRTTDGEGREGP
jgi:hypothetical protein